MKKNAYKLPSGQYRVRGYYKDSAGVAHRRSFTAPSLEEAEYLLAEWKKSGREAARAPQAVSVRDAVAQYIDLKRAVLSPSTVRAYVKALDNHIAPAPVGAVDVREVTSVDLQLFVSSLAGSVGPKTVKNVYGLLISAISLIRPEERFRVTLPQRQKTDIYCPSDDDIGRLLAHVRAHGMADLERAIMLAAFGTLRRGEICALMAEDIKGDTIHVHRSMVRDETDTYVVKSPKTYESDRYVEMPPFFADMVKGVKGRVVSCDPDALSNRFARAARSAGVPQIHLHSLRHYSASILHAIGVPDQYIMARGGWATDNVMKSVYRNVIDLEKVRQDKKITAHFSKFANGQNE